MSTGTRRGSPLRTRLELVKNYDIVLDGSEQFSRRAFLVNDACYLGGRTLVSAAVGQFDGQLAVFKAHERHGGKHTYPCYPLPLSGSAAARQRAVLHRGRDFGCAHGRDGDVASARGPEGNLYKSVRRWPDG